MKTIVIETIDGTISAYDNDSEKLYPTRFMNIGQDHEDIFEACWHYIDEMELDIDDVEILLNLKPVEIFDL